MSWHRNNPDNFTYDGIVCHNLCMQGHYYSAYINRIIPKLNICPKYLSSQIGITHDLSNTIGKKQECDRLEGRVERPSSLNHLWLMRLKVHIAKVYSPGSPCGAPPRALAVACASQDPEANFSAPRQSWLRVHLGLWYCWCRLLQDLLNCSLAFGVSSLIYSHSALQVKISFETPVWLSWQGSRGVEPLERSLGWVTYFVFDSIQNIYICKPWFYFW